MALIAIDPGKVTGVARFSSALAFATICTEEECLELIAERNPCDGCGSTTCGPEYYRVSKKCCPDCTHGGDCIIEVPQIYPGQQQKGDQNDLIDLAVVVGRYVECASAQCFRVRLVKPREWKGQLPKDVCWQRVRETLTAVELEHMEKVPKSKAHNMHDAIGLGTWFQKRWR